MWGTTYTARVNALNFGVRITGVSANKNNVRIRIYFADEGLPLNIPRGGGLANTGLFNLFGDSLVAAFYVAGNAGEVHAGGMWEGGGEPGQQRGGGPPLSGSPAQRWATLSPLWFWQARGMKTPSIDWTGGPFSGTITVTDYIVMRNPSALPRFAYSSDNGATWTWIRNPAEDDSAAYIAANAGTISTGNIVFLDNAASLDYWKVSPGSWASGLFEDRPTAATAYRYAYYQLRYGNTGTDASAVAAINTYVSWRGYSGYPKVSTGTGTLWIMAESSNGNIRRMGIVSGSGSIAAPALSSVSLPRAPGNIPWTPTAVGDLQVKLNSGPSTDSSWAGLANIQNGAAIYGMHHELLVPATADPPATPCGGWVDLTRVKYRGFEEGDI
jgi:hypothetical protein